MRILGIHDGHNASACLLDDGVLRVAIQEERLVREKNWSGIPVQAIGRILETTGLLPVDIDTVAMNGHHMPYPKSRQAMLREFGATGTIGATVKKGLRHTFLKTVYQSRRAQQRVRAMADLGFEANRVKFVDHHMAHASAAYFGFGDHDKKILVLTNDGAGDGLCGSVNIAQGGNIERIAEVPEADSIGNLYGITTFLLGMVPLEHEYKLMGMAPYANEEAAERVADLFRQLLLLSKSDPLVWQRSGRCPETYFSYDFLRDLLELKRFDAICGGLQRFTEELVTKWVRSCIQATGVNDVCLGGGVFMNVKLNKAILELPEVDRLFVYPSCGDESNAMGAAYWVHNEARGPSELSPLGSLYLGSCYSEDSIESALGGKTGLRHTKEADIESRVATLLAEGHVVARFKGRAEFGARALGNRSLLADPCREDVVREINEMIKSRDFWMPFAPSVLEEDLDELLENPKRFFSPYMMMALDTRDPASLKGATHPYDHTARPQAVRESYNPDYHRLIRLFKERTGRGAVLNTSFNLHGYPIVETPEDALQVLEQSGLRYLAIGDVLVEKAEGHG